MCVGNEAVGNKYPEDVKYNICQIGDKMVHNFKFTDKRINEIIEENNLKRVQVSQGYSNCSIAVIAENAVIVADNKIAEVLRRFDIDVLCLESVPDIKLLKDKSEYSEMNGFIGGAMARIDSKVIVFGDLKKIDESGEILNFIEKYNLELIDFEGLDVVDYGGVVVI